MVEDSRAHLFRHPAAGIADFQPHVIPSGQIAVVRSDPGGRRCDCNRSSPLRDRLGGIGDQIQNHLLDLRRAGPYGGEIQGEFHFQVGAFGDGSFQKIEHFAHQRRHIDRGLNICRSSVP